MYFKVKSSILDVDIETRDKYVFISGFSGAGKSLFVLEVNRLIEVGNLDGEIKSDLSYHVISNKENIEGLDMYIQEDKPCIFIADEFYANKLVLAIKDKNAYCICVTRHPPKNINFSYRCLYKATRGTDGVTVIRPEIRLKSVKERSKYNLLLTDLKLKSL